jgi:hypothetical protein
VRDPLYHAARKLWQSGETVTAERPLAALRWLSAVAPDPPTRTPHAVLAGHGKVGDSRLSTPPSRRPRRKPAQRDESWSRIGEVGGVQVGTLAGEEWARATGKLEAFRGFGALSLG